MAKKLKAFQIIDAITLLMLQNDKFLDAKLKKRNKELREIVEEKYKISPRQAQRYIKEARESIDEITQMNKQAHFFRAIRRREFLYGKTVEGKDYKTADIIAKRIEELLDLYPDKRIDHGGTIQHEITGIEYVVPGSEEETNED